ncbi:hypothetical protein V7793_05285 [Streptomyces sp. KLMMK]
MNDDFPHTHWSVPYKQFPETAQFPDPGFVQRYAQIAARLRAALDNRPAR